jgi:hypothetical protein
MTYLLNVAVVVLAVPVVPVILLAIVPVIAKIILPKNYPAPLIIIIAIIPIVAEIANLRRARQVNAENRPRTIRRLAPLAVQANHAVQNLLRIDRITATWCCLTASANLNPYAAYFLIELGAVLTCVPT